VGYIAWSSILCITVFRCWSRLHRQQRRTSTMLSRRTRTACWLTLLITAWLTDVSASSVCLGNAFSYVILADQSVSTLTTSLPRAPKGQFAQVSCSDQHACGVLLNGSVLCWYERYQYFASVASLTFACHCARLLRRCLNTNSGFLSLSGTPQERFCAEVCGSCCSELPRTSAGCSHVRTGWKFHSSQRRH